MAAITSIPDNDRRERFVAAGGQTDFPFDFPVYSPQHIALFRRRGGVESQLTYGLDYGVTGAGDQGGGVATLLTPAEGGDIIVVKSAQPIARSNNFVDGGDLPAESLNAEGNRVYIAFQQMRDALARTIRVPETDPNGLLLPNASQRADAIFAFDSDGNPLMLQPDLSEHDIDRAYVQLLVTNALNRALPRSILMPYSGSLSDIPEGWQLCDGSNGTPDMRDRFIVCAGPTRPHLSTGGTSSATTEPGGGHDHDGQTGETALSVDQLPPHKHSMGSTVVRNTGSGGVIGSVGVYSDGASETENTGSGQAHRHPLTAAPPHQHAVTVNPPYYALAFIARTGFFVPPPEIGEVPQLTDAALAVEMAFACADEATAIDETGLRFTGRAWLAMNVQEILVTLNSPCASGTFTVDVRINGVSILSTLVTIDAGEEVSSSAAIPAVISAPTVSKLDKVQVFATDVGDGTATGLKVMLLGQRVVA